MSYEYSGYHLISYKQCKHFFGHKVPISGQSYMYLRWNVFGSGDNILLSIVSGAHCIPSHSGLCTCKYAKYTAQLMRPGIG